MQLLPLLFKWPNCAVIKPTKTYRYSNEIELLNYMPKTKVQSER